MKFHKKKLSVTIVILLLLITVNTVAYAESTETDDTEETDETQQDLANPYGLSEPRKFLKYVLGRYVIASLSPAMTFFVAVPNANPEVIEIGINETVVVDIGIIDYTTDDYEEEQTNIDAKQFLLAEVVEYPGGVNDGSWFVSFDPSSVVVGPGSPKHMKMTISLKSPPNPENPVQSGVLKLNLVDKWACGNIFVPTEGPKLGWFIGAVTAGWGFQLTGKVVYDEIPLNILVKVKPYHYAKVESLPLINLEPNEVTSIPIDIQNLGNYNDTFGFNITSENGDIKISNPVTVTLSPGEKQETLLGVSTPRKFFDFGTVHNVKLQVFSYDDPNNIIGEKTVFLQTKGMYVSEFVLVLLFIFFILIVLIIGVVIYLRRRKIQDLVMKPDKPWEIDKEKKNLDKLQEKDPEKYKETMNMMKDEYKSSILWYKDHLKSLRKKPKDEPQETKEGDKQ